MRLLVTGGAGFIGANFVRYWLQEHPDDRVVVYDLLTYAGNRASLADVDERIGFVEGDITDPDTIARALADEEIDTIVPALVLAVTFGLSMDYEVFLLTRIRERYVLHGRNDQAVAEGLVGSARIITSAALVMVAVFAAFAVAGAPSLRELGVGLAVAVGLDASLVRLVVVPATMRLLGDWNWWVPRRLAKLLPAPAPLG